jgi:predicted Rossmann fold flavoprotein
MSFSPVPEGIMNGEIYIIGGGASGLMAALAAAELGSRVVVLEKTDRPGRKLSITGNGRCNLTTADSPEAAAAAFGPGGRFLRSAFSRFFSGELISLFSRLGVPVAKEEGRGYYPLSGFASDVTGALVKRLKELGVELRANTAVESIVVEEGRAAGLETGGGFIGANRIAIATGGASYPATGATGDGYRIAAALGHRIVSPLPSVVPLVFNGGLHKELAPLSFENVSAALYLDGKLLCESVGDILFTPWGATGPAALALGKTAAANAGKGGLSLTVDFKHGIGTAGLDKILMEKFASGGRQTAPQILSELFPRRAAFTFSWHAGLPEKRMGCQVTAAERARLVGLLAGCRFGVSGTRPIEEAMVTAGGVALNEVNPKTMESKIVKGLYIIGELLDLDAGTGGYNLQAAFSTGYVAGCSASGD